MQVINRRDKICICIKITRGTYFVYGFNFFFLIYISEDSNFYHCEKTIIFTSDCVRAYRFEIKFIS